MKSAHIPDRKSLQITAQLRSDIALRKILLLELEIMEFNEARFIRQHDIECLHDYRVALRRSRIILSRMPGVFPVREVHRFGATFFRLGQLTGSCRDLDVFLEHWPEYADASDAASQRVYNFLQQQRDQARSNLVNELRGEKNALFKKHWRDYLASEPGTTRMPHAKTPISVMAGEQIHLVLRKVSKKLRLITRGSSDRKIHKLRIACKRLRYLLDCFQNIQTNDASEKLIPDLKKLQDKLGAYQDLIVQRGVINSMDKQMVTAGMMTDDVRQAILSIENALNERASSQREVVMEAIRKFLRSDALESMLHGN